MSRANHLPIGAEWCRYASVIKAIIGSDNGLLPDQRQAIAWTNDILSIRSSDNDSTGLWPPGSLHTLGAGGHI